MADFLMARVDLAELLKSLVVTAWPDLQTLASVAEAKTAIDLLRP
jgi:hypothetical protein